MAYFRLSLDHTYHRTVPAETAVTHQGSVNGMIGKGRGGISFALALDHHFSWRGVLGLEAGWAQVPLGYYLAFVPPSGYGLGEVEFTSGQDRANMQRTFACLRAGYAFQLSRRFLLLASIGVRLSNLPRNGALWIHYDSQVNDSTNIRFFTMSLDINAEKKPYVSSIFRLGGTFVLSRRVDMSLFAGAEFFSQDAAAGTYTVLPELPDQATSGSIRQSANNASIAFTLGYRFASP